MYGLEFKGVYISRTCFPDVKIRRFLNHTEAGTSLGNNDLGVSY